MSRHTSEMRFGEIGGERENVWYENVIVISIVWFIVFHIVQGGWKFTLPPPTFLSPPSIPVWQIQWCKENDGEHTDKIIDLLS